MISQALTNLIKNAGEAIETAQESGERTVTRPEIRIAKIIEEHGGTLTLTDATVFDGNAHAGACAIITLPVVPMGAAANKIPA